MGKAVYHGSMYEIAERFANKRSKFDTTYKGLFSCVDYYLKCRGTYLSQEEIYSRSLLESPTSLILKKKWRRKKKKKENEYNIVI